MAKYKFIVLILISLTLTVMAKSPFHTPEGKGEVKDGMSLLSKDSVKSKTVEDPLDNLKDSQVFVQIGSDALTWKSVRDQAELRVEQSFNIPDSLNADEREKMRRIAVKRSVSMLLKRYLRNAVLADMARKAGIELRPGELDSAVEKAIVDNEKRGTAGKKQAALLKEKDSLIVHNIANVLLIDKYRTEKVLPGLEVSAQEKLDFMQKRHDENLSVSETNRLLKASLVNIHRRIKSGRLDFSQAAADYSECGSSTEGGCLGVMEFNGGMRKEWETALRKMKPGEISEIVETPFSYHILKLKDFAYDDGFERRPENAKGADIAHIMLEKAYLKPELTEDQAMKMLLNAKAYDSLESAWIPALTNGTVYCAIPLTTPKGRKGAK